MKQGLNSCKNIDIITLGCSKNLVDSERLMGRLEAAGFRCAHDPEDPKGNIAVINTCGFIGDAKEESINTILQFAQRKNEGTLDRLYVMGCLSERYLKELEPEIPEVDKWFGKFNFLALLDELGVQASETRHITTPKHYAYLKISEGCNRMCSYCAIPLITGRHTSRPIEEIIHEVEWLRDQGVKEVNVIAQDLSSYGLDLYHSHKLAELVDRIADISGIEWIRLHYTYPTDFPEDVLDVMARRGNVCKYLDIALQHCTDHMLSLMRRHITAVEQDALIRHIRERVPSICLRTTLLVGHPGETEEDFEALKQWVREMRFDRMGAFAYSDEDGTYAHLHYRDDVPEEVKQRRVDELMAIQQEVSQELMQQQVGTIQRVIIDSEESDYFIGRTEHDSPEVDCNVLIDKKEVGSQPLQIGAFYDVHINKAEEFDLFGTIWNRN